MGEGNLYCPRSWCPNGDTTRVLFASGLQEKASVHLKENLLWIFHLGWLQPYLKGGRQKTNPSTSAALLRKKRVAVTCSKSSRDTFFPVRLLWLPLSSPTPSPSHFYLILRFTLMISEFIFYGAHPPPLLGVTVNGEIYDRTVTYPH